MSKSYKIKVLIASGSRHSIPPLKHSPGVARIIYKLANNLDKDNQIRVISKYHDDLHSISYDNSVFLHPKLNIKKQFQKQLLSHVPYRVLKKKYGFTQIDRILYYTGVVELAKKQVPEVVITFMHFELFKMLKKALPNAKHIFFFRSTDLVGRIGQDNVIYLIENSSGFLANTKAPVLELREIGNISFPMQTIYNSIPTQTKSKEELQEARKSTRSHFKIDIDAIVIGFAGRFSKEKSLLELFEAVKYQRDRGLDFQILIAGDIQNEKTPNHAYYQQLKEFEKNHLQDAVHWMGWVTHDDLYKFYTAIDFSVVLSKYREGNSMFLLESFSYGKPVIATSIGGNKEVITQGENGFLIDYTHIYKDLCFVFADINSKREKYPYWSFNASNYVEVNHTEDKMIKEFNSFLNKMNL